MRKLLALIFALNVVPAMAAGSGAPYFGTTKTDSLILPGLTGIVQANGASPVTAIPIGSGIAAALGAAPTGTGSIVLGTSPTITTPTISGSAAFSGTSGGVAGSIFANSSNGLAMRSLTGSVNDFSLGNPSGSAYYMNVPTGSLTPTFPNGANVGAPGTTLGYLNVTNPGDAVTGTHLPSITVGTYSPTQSTADYTTVGSLFLLSEDYGSFGDGNVHIGFNVNGGKSRSTSNTTGSWELLDVTYYSYGGGTANSFITAAHELMYPVAAGSYNIYGNYTGNNPQIVIPTGYSAAGIVAEEADVTALSAASNVREGLRVVDIGSTAFGAVTDAGIGISAVSAVRFQNGITFGDTGQPSTFPVTSGGNIISTGGSSEVLNAFVNFVGLSGTPTIAALALPSNIREACFGASCGGGSIVSATTSNGGQLVYSSNLISINWSSNIWNVDNNGNMNAGGSINSAAGYYSNLTPGVTCSGTPTALFATKMGIVTHC